MLKFWPMFGRRSNDRISVRGVEVAGDGGGDDRLVLVQGYEWAGAQRWPQNHPKAWISDPADNFRYEAHHYWDRNNSGAYTNGYEAEVADAQQRGF